MTPLNPKASNSKLIQAQGNYSLLCGLFLPTTLVYQNVCPSHKLMYKPFTQKKHKRTAQMQNLPINDQRHKMTAEDINNERICKEVVTLEELERSTAQVGQYVNKTTITGC